jgi:hypothetical protein
MLHLLGQRLMVARVLGMLMVFVILQHHRNEPRRSRYMAGMMQAPALYASRRTAFEMQLTLAHSTRSSLRL